MTLEKATIEVLFHLESLEAKGLVWGDSGGAFTEDELLDLIYKVTPEYEPDDIRDHLLNLAAICEISKRRGPPLYRTRMGEATHLFRNLRQWFHGQSLSGASTLVSDFRFLHRPRTYPKRNHEVTTFVDSISKDLELSATKREALVTLLGGVGSKWKLAGFQERACRRIFRAWQQHNTTRVGASGTVVCAGTGSGKTLAFYLPALASLSEDIVANSENRVRILAIYPRKELLKDQLHETWSECRKLDSLLLSRRTRKIRVGALFGDTPRSARYASNHQGQSVDVDLLRCPTKNCRGVMRWTATDISKNNEVVSCSSCQHTVASDEFVLTRDTLRCNPPDILFTTTEMLNQRLNDSDFKQLFGVDRSSTLPLVLLDEIHTYSGVTGAQTAFLLRRWMARSKNRPHFVGLSATLEDAQQFFSSLTSCNPGRTELVEPRPDELESEGAEYFLALRGDPVSQTALMSTTIQTAMLTKRVLDERTELCSEGIWGSRTFIFTDNLDVTNRLFHNIVDAEGWRLGFNQNLEPHHEPLATLRNPNFVSAEFTESERINKGQNWSMSYEIGHTLDENDRARIDRTSSQDLGVDANCDLVVASSTLEVGFNDPSVGAVIQHKAPMDMASYVQRKGRAGRGRKMRPWMITVLSAFGRDRDAFQRYEELADPYIKPMSLPIANKHIIKMQAAMACLDWFSTQIATGSIWHFLCQPNSNAKYWRKSNKGLQKDLLRVVESVLLEPDSLGRLSRYLKVALGIDESAVDEALWAPPRSIMLEFLPWLRNVLRYSWSLNGVEWEALSGGRSPVPGFLSSTLFEALGSEDISIRLDRRTGTQWESESFFKALREYSPGRVSKRYAIRHSLDADWVVPEGYEPESGAENEILIDVDEVFGKNIAHLGKVTGTCSGNSLTLLQPRLIKPKVLELRKITDTSNAFSQWDFQITAPESVVEQEIASNAPLSGLFKNISFFLHQNSEPIEMARFSTGSEAQIRFKNGQEPARPKFLWSREGELIAIGTKLWVDGVRFRFQVTNQAIAQAISDEQILRAIRSFYFRHLVSGLNYFAGNTFLADWVCDIFLTAVATEAVDKQCSVSKAIDAIVHENAATPLIAFPVGMFQMQRGLQGELEEQKLQEQLVDALSSKNLRVELQEIARALWDDLVVEGEFLTWLRGVVADTTGASVLQAALQIVPNANERQLAVDINFADEALDVWLSETESGGVGALTQLHSSYAENPLQFQKLFAYAIDASDYEQVDVDLQNILKDAQIESEIAASFRTIREASSLSERQLGNERLKSILPQHGYIASHSLMAVLHSRVLRSGSSHITDQRLHKLTEKWTETEEQLGIEIPLFSISHVLSRLDNPTALPDAIFKNMCVIQGLLWNRGSPVRQVGLSFYNEFRSDSVNTERLLVKALCPHSVPIVEYQNGWQEALQQSFRKSPLVDIQTKIEDADTHELLALLIITSIEIDALILFPRVTAARREKNYWLIRVELAEVVF